MTSVEDQLDRAAREVTDQLSTIPIPPHASLERNRAGRSRWALVGAAAALVIVLLAGIAFAGLSDRGDRDGDEAVVADSPPNEGQSTEIELEATLLDGRTVAVTAPESYRGFDLTTIGAAIDVSASSPSIRPVSLIVEHTSIAGWTEQHGDPQLIQINDATGLSLATGGDLAGDALVWDRGDQVAVVSLPALPENDLEPLVDTLARDLAIQSSGSNGSSVRVSGLPVSDLTASFDRGDDSGELVLTARSCDDSINSDYSSAAGFQRRCGAAGEMIATLYAAEPSLAEVNLTVRD